MQSSPGTESEREELHLLDRWCHLGTARDEHEIAELLESAAPRAFDLDIYRIITGMLARPPRNIRLIELAAAMRVAA